jgi:hypothetical protein
MKTSRYKSSHGGTQPIRVLQHNVVSGFENANPGFLAQLKRLIADKGLQPGISYLVQDSAICGSGGVGSPAVCSRSRKIQISETFLSYIWGITYALVVIFNELIRKPALATHGQQEERYPELLRGADQLLSYATSLIWRYSTWDKDSLPNPEFYDAEADPYIEQANGGFVPAVVFVLCHEVAHVSLGHCDLDNLGVYVSSMDSKLDETAADDYAIDTMRKNPANGRFQQPEAVGIIAGLASLLMLSKEVREERHPDTDERLIAGVQHLRLPEESPLWGLGLAAIKLWDTHYDRGLTWPGASDTCKAAFDEMAGKMTQRPSR